MFLCRGDHGYARISAAKDGLLSTDCSWGVPTLTSPPSLVVASEKRQKQPHTNSPLAVRFSGGRLAKRTQPRLPSVVLSALPQDYIADEDVPLSYDTRSLLGKDYTTVSRSQNIPHACGSCWIQSSVAAVSDRIKLMRKAVWPEVCFLTIATHGPCWGLHTERHAPPFLTLVAAGGVVGAGGARLQ